MDFFLLRIFQMQLRLQCKFFKTSSDELTTSLSTIKVDPAFRANLAFRAELSTRIWASIETMLTAGGNISKILWGQPQRKLESLRKPIRDSLAIADNSPVRPLAMRNNFEHFDERIDTWWRESPNHNVADLTLGSSAMLGGFKDIELWRCFDPDTMDVTFWGDRFNLRLVCDEVDAILAKIDAELAKDNLTASREHARRSAIP